MRPLGPVPVPAENPTTPAKIALGKRLFFDPILSGSNRMSCASCHRPDHGFADVRRLSPGDGGKDVARHTPGLLNVAYNLTQFWDGRAKSLEEQALAPVENPAEMDQRVETLLPELERAGYGAEFGEAFGTGVSAESLARALAAYERTLLENDTPFDRWMRGDERAMSYAAVRGLLIFNTKGRCIACHSGPNVTNAAHAFGNAFMNIGVKPVAGDPTDPGRIAVLADEGLRRKIFEGAFKVPSLRGVGRTAPYMHNGSLATLEDVVEFYMRGGDAGKLRPARLTPEEKVYLVAFLREGLTGRP
ncbi:cytochrome-c peroxidase [bacterium]|nr:MAG: cytochrome-c peroxidase [bacterium]